MMHRISVTFRAGEATAHPVLGSHEPLSASLCNGALCRVVFVGTGVVVGEIYFAVFVAAAVVAVPLLLMPMERVLSGGWAVTFRVAGPLRYFAHISKAFWLPYLFGVPLSIRLPMTLMARRPSAANVIATDNR